MMTDDDELAIKAESDDAPTFRLLQERHYDRIYRVVYRFFANRADAEDIVQDVCIVLSIQLKTFTTLGSKRDDKFGYRTKFINLARLAKTAAALEQQH